MVHLQPLNSNIDFSIIIISVSWCFCILQIFVLDNYIRIFTGQILEALKQTEKAVASYKTCYQLDNSQVSTNYILQATRPATCWTIHRYSATRPPASWKIHSQVRDKLQDLTIHRLVSTTSYKACYMRYIQCSSIHRLVEPATN